MVFWYLLCSHKRLHERHMSRMCLFPQVNSEEERLFDEKFSDIPQLSCISPIAILLDFIKICFKSVAIQEFYYFFNDKRWQKNESTIYSKAFFLHVSLLISNQNLSSTYYLYELKTFEDKLAPQKKKFLIWKHSFCWDWSLLRYYHWLHDLSWMVNKEWECVSISFSHVLNLYLVLECFSQFDRTDPGSGSLGIVYHLLLSDSKCITPW